LIIKAKKQNHYDIQTFIIDISSNINRTNSM